MHRDLGGCGWRGARRARSSRASSTRSSPATASTRTRRSAACRSRERQMVEIAMAFSDAGIAAAARDPGRADLVAGRGPGRPASCPCPPLRRGGRRGDPDLAYPGRGPVDRRPHRGDEGRPDRRRTPGRRPSPMRRWSRRWAAPATRRRPRRAARSRSGEPVLRPRPAAAGSTFVAARARSSGLPVLAATARPTCCWRSSTGTARLAGRAAIPQVTFVAGDRRTNGIFAALVDPAEHDRRRAAATCRAAASWTARPRPQAARTGRPGSASARRTWTTASCRCRAATSRRCCSPARCPPGPRSS